MTTRKTETTTVLKTEHHDHYTLGAITVHVCVRVEDERTTCSAAAHHGTQMIAWAGGRATKIEAMGALCAELATLLAALNGASGPAEQLLAELCEAAELAREEQLS